MTTTRTQRMINDVMLYVGDVDGSEEVRTIVRQALRDGLVSPREIAQIVIAARRNNTEVDCTGCGGIGGCDCREVSDAQ